jgi:TonB family protein
VTIRSLPLVAALVLFIGSAHPAVACPLSIAFAALQATGTERASRAYIAYLDGKVRKGDAVAFTLDTGKGVATVRVDDATSGAVLFVVPRADATSIGIVGCTDSKPYEIRPTALTRDFTFDDTAGWIQGTAPTAIPIAPPSLTTILLPDYAARAHRRNLQGEVHLVVAIGRDGVVQDAEALEPSGSFDLDQLAINAGMTLRFVPARLPAQAGGGALDAVVDVTITFTPGTVTASLH